MSVEFVQYMDDYFVKENEEFKKWLFEEYIEKGLEEGTVSLGEVEDIGGLGSVGTGLDMLERGVVRGRKLVFRPDLD